MNTVRIRPENDLPPCRCLVCRLPYTSEMDYDSSVGFDKVYRFRVDPGVTPAKRRLTEYGTFVAVPQPKPPRQRS